MKQTTLQTPISCSGIGLHSGDIVHMTIKPAAADSGIVFVRTDMRKGNRVQARFDLVGDTRLGTTLRNKHGVIVATVEHLMAALWGAGIDNAVIELDKPEVPIMDGSSAPFSALIAQAGLKTLDMPRAWLRVLRPVEIHEGRSFARLEPSMDDEPGFSLEIDVEYDSKVVGRQQAFYDFRATRFDRALSNARTFGFAHEVEAMRHAGLALGGSLENAVVVGEEGVLNEEGLRSADEFVRHKALDVVGDFFLSGFYLDAHATMTRPGHGINNKLLRALFADRANWRLVRESAPVSTRPMPVREAYAFA